MLLATSCKFARHLLYSVRYNEMPCAALSYKLTQLGCDQSYTSENCATNILLTMCVRVCMRVCVERERVRVLQEIPS